MAREDAWKRTEAKYLAMERMQETDAEGFNQIPVGDRIAFAYWMLARERSAKASAA
jgi:hypothetical protein